MRDRIKQLAPDVIFYHEVPTQTVESLDILFGRVFELSAGLKTWYLIVDIRESAAPSPEVRDRLRQIYAKADGLKHAILITGLSRILRLFVQFVAGNAIKIPFSVVKDLDSALSRIKDIKKYSA